VRACENNLSFHQQAMVPAGMWKTDDVDSIEAHLFRDVIRMQDHLRSEQHEKLLEDQGSTRNEGQPLIPRAIKSKVKVRNIQHRVNYIKISRKASD
jgi:hypothetical protein